MDYKIEPSEEMQRKLDFYYTPYSDSIHLFKSMTFDDRTELKEFVTCFDEPTMKRFGRFLKIRTNPCVGYNYMTKLDLLETHPEMFLENGGQTG